MIVPSELIKKKRDGQAHTPGEIRTLVELYTTGELPDYQMAAWLMAAFCRGLSGSETLELAEAMLHSGVILDHSEIPGVKIDKHSTGGVGDKTSLIIGPICAACGVVVPMMAGRGLAHTGGTIDKLESIPGFQTQLDMPKFKQMLFQHRLAFIGQTRDICPADKKMYALRDVTATVDSIPLICASIMSKKLAEGADGLVLDVKAGSGAFMKSQADAVKLAVELTQLGRRAGKKVSAFVTSMEQPLGEKIGNALEVEECVDILKNQHCELAEDTRELSLHLSAEMIRLAGIDQDFMKARKRAEEALTSGRAFEVFEKVCQAQGGRLGELPSPRLEAQVQALESGYVAAFDTEKIGFANVLLGAGHLRMEDLIDPVAGIRCHRKIGDRVEAKDILFTLYSSDERKFARVQAELAKSVTISLQKVKPTSLILQELCQ